MTRTSTLFKMRALAALAALAFTLAQSGGFANQVKAAELAKEGTFSVRAAWSGASQGFGLGEDHWVRTYDFKGVVTNDDGQGFLHNTSLRCIGLGRTFKGVTENSGNCVHTDLDGDTIFDSWQDEGTVSTGARGVGNLIGGTGKYAGIQGTFHYKRIGLTPVAEGTFQGYTVRFTGNWKLP